MSASASGVAAVYLVCATCGLQPPVPETENFNSGWPATISFDAYEGRLCVVPHLPGCWRLETAVVRARGIQTERGVERLTDGSGVRFSE